MQEQSRRRAGGRVSKKRPNVHVRVLVRMRERERET